MLCISIETCEVNNSIVTLDNPKFVPLGGDNRKSSVCVENMAIADRFAARSEEEIANILCEKDAENTRRSTKSAVKCLQQYLLETNADSLNFDDYLPEELAVFLTKFYAYKYHFLSIINLRLLS